MDRSLSQFQQFAQQQLQFHPQLYRTPDVTEKEVLQIREAFDLFDFQGTGLIDSKQLMISMTSLGFEPENQALYDAIAALDTIDFPTFLNLMTARLSKKDSRQNLQRIFGLFDPQNSGYISMQSLQRVVEQVGAQIEEKELTEMIKRADLDHDGQISEYEFYRIMTSNNLKH